MNEAIKLAIKGGFGKQYPSHWDLTQSDTIGKETIILDPLFWQALGKALGWSKHDDEVYFWRKVALSYFETVMTGGDTEKFWSDLLKGE